VEFISVEQGGLRFSVASDSAALRVTIEEQFGWSTGQRESDVGLIISAPATSSETSSNGARPMWLVYESGSIVLRRHPDESGAVDAALFHLWTLSEAVGTDLLPTRLRPIILADGSALLLEPRVAVELAGIDRRLLSKGITVLPTTIAIVDPKTASVELAKQDFQPEVPAGSFPISRIILASRPGEPDAPISSLLNLTRGALRIPDQDVEQMLGHFGHLYDAIADRIELLPLARAKDEIATLGKNVG
jgi:hypothetical protein